ncbi:TRC40/GET3/ArsA family transport-energizing ATPase [soil metagenome]
MPVPRLLDRRILFFGGKGGVGKTTLAAAYAILSAEEGARTLLVSTDPAHSISDILDHPLGPEPREVLDRLWAIEIDPEMETERYIAGVKARVREVTSPRLLAEVEREIDVARVSPGAEEAALFERFAELMQLAGGEYDRVIFDTAPTGHTLRLLSLPELMTVWIAGLVSRRRKMSALGRMWRNVAGAAAGEEREENDPVLEILERRQERFRQARALVTDAALAAFVFVLIPERLPILETRKATDALTRYRVPVGAVIVNRVLPADAEGPFLARRRERERHYLEEIESSFRGSRLFHLPLFETDVHGLAALRRVMDALPPEERDPR